MKFFIFLIFIITATSCSFLRVDKQEAAANKCIGDLIKSQNSSNELKVMGTGASNPNGVYEKLHVHFYCYKRLTVPEARKLFVASALEFIERMNANENLREFLENYPATINNIKLSISFFDYTGKNLGERVYPPYVDYVFCCDDTIIYTFDDRTHPLFSHKYEETFEEALRIVNGEQEDPCLWKNPTPIAETLRQIRENRERYKAAKQANTDNDTKNVIDRE